MVPVPPTQGFLAANPAYALLAWVDWFSYTTNAAGVVSFNMAPVPLHDCPVISRNFTKSPHDMWPRTAEGTANTGVAGAAHQHQSEHRWLLVPTSVFYTNQQGVVVDSKWLVLHRNSHFVDSKNFW